MARTVRSKHSKHLVEVISALRSQLCLMLGKYAVVVPAIVGNVEDTVMKERSSEVLKFRVYKFWH